MPLVDAVMRTQALHSVMMSDQIPLSTRSQTAPMIFMQGQSSKYLHELQQQPLPVRLKSSHLLSPFEETRIPSDEEQEAAHTLWLLSKERPSATSHQATFDTLKDPTAKIQAAIREELEMMTDIVHVMVEEAGFKIDRILQDHSEELRHFYEARLRRMVLEEIGEI